MEEGNSSSKWVKASDGDVPYYYCTDDVDDSDGDSGNETVYVLDIVEEDNEVGDGRHHENSLTTQDVSHIIRSQNEAIHKTDEGESIPIVNNLESFTIKIEPANESDNASVFHNTASHSVVDVTRNAIVSKLFQCRICGKCCTNETKLHAHSRVHCDGRPFQCHICGKQFTLNSNLKTHLRTHSGTKPYQCVYCSESFTYLHSLQRHVRVHNNGNFFECTDCNRKFISKSLLESHLNSHVKASSATVTESVKKSKSSEDNQRIEGTESAEKLVESAEESDHKPADESPADRRLETGDSGCDKVVKESCDSLQNATKAHGSSEGDPGASSNDSDCISDNLVNNDLHEKCKMANGFYKCPKCEKVTGRKWEFYRHYRKHLGLRPFQCHYCLKTFTVRCNLNTHLRLHTGVKPYHCLHCNERFMYLHSLQRHIRIHNNGKFLECEKCNRKFTNTEELKSHLQLHFQKPDITIEFDNAAGGLWNGREVAIQLGSNRTAQEQETLTTQPSSTQQDSDNTKGDCFKSTLPEDSTAEQGNIDTGQRNDLRNEAEFRDEIKYLSVSNASHIKNVTEKPSLSFSDSVTDTSSIRITPHISSTSFSSSSSELFQSRHKELLEANECSPARIVSGLPQFPNYTTSSRNDMVKQGNLLHDSFTKSPNEMLENGHKDEADKLGAKQQYQIKFSPKYAQSSSSGDFHVEISPNVPFNGKIHDEYLKEKHIKEFYKNSEETAAVYILDDDQNIREEVRPTHETTSEDTKPNVFEPSVEGNINKEEEESKEHIARLQEHFFRSVKIENGCFICQLCGKELWRKSEMQKHLRIHYGIKPFICNYCSKSFTLNCNLKAHLRLHTGTLPYKCQECGQRFMYIHSLQRHARVHNNGKFFECVDCNRRFTGAKEHLEHMLSHKLSSSITRRDIQYPPAPLSNIAQATGVSGDTLNESIEKYSSGENDRKLNIATSLHSSDFPISIKKEDTNSYPDEHLHEKRAIDHHSQGTPLKFETMHNVAPQGIGYPDTKGFPPFLSRPCYPDYNHEGQLAVKPEGYSAATNLDKPFVCNICSKRFTVKCNLKTHMRLHSGDKPYACTVCGERFMYLHSLQRHVRVHNSGRFLECRDCNRRFISKEELTQHETMHTLGQGYYKAFSVTPKQEENIEPRHEFLNRGIGINENYRSKFPYFLKAEDHAKPYFIKQEDTVEQENSGHFSDMINIDYARSKTAGQNGIVDLYSNINHSYLSKAHNSSSQSEAGSLSMHAASSPDERGKEFQHQQDISSNPSHGIDQGNGLFVTGKECRETDATISITKFTTAEVSQEERGVGVSSNTNSTISSAAYINQISDSIYDPLLQRKEFQCPYCARVLTRKWDFDRHMRKHSGQKPFVCEFCGKSFGLNSSLKAHVRIHTNEQPYSCEECGLKFTYLHSLQRHVRIHNNGHFLECNECNRRFTTKMDYIVHMRCRHGILIGQGVDETPTEVHTNNQTGICHLPS